MEEKDHRIRELQHQIEEQQVRNFNIKIAQYTIMLFLQERHKAEQEEGHKHIHQLQSEVQAKDDLIHQLQNDDAAKNSQLESLSRQR